MSTPGISGPSTTGIKKIRSALPLITEKVQEGISKDLEASLKALFVSYVEKRERIKTMLKEQYPGKTLSCTQAREMVEQLGVNSFLLGSVCDEVGYRITNCWLGCF